MKHGFKILLPQALAECPEWAQGNRSWSLRTQTVPESVARGECANKPVESRHEPCKKYADANQREYGNHIGQNRDGLVKVMEWPPGPTPTPNDREHNLIRRHCQ